MDPEHAIPRSKGAIGVSTLENLWLSCRVCHNQKTSAYVQGRLKPIPLGQGRFRFELWYGKNREAAVLSRAWENPARLT
jgi:5-methylcytosine-specific restriction endonuclease McrA